ncbi:MAG: DNA recombination/repair protein RecA [Cystobacterineae bacterium]|nr:DNA recombination/repair protein RecA [Cystobacterineae bacterium]
MGVWSEKFNRLTEILRGVEKQFGKETAVQLGGQLSLAPIGSVPTGSLALDRALGCGGYPRGRITELSGQDSSGKTSLALLAIAAVQAQEGVAAFVDAEHALNAAYAQKLGVQTEQLVFIRTSTAEQTWGVVERLLHNNAVDLVVVDSVTALLPKAEMESEQALQGNLQAQTLSHALRKLSGPLSNSSCALLLINQLRYAASPPPSLANTPGGVALKFLSSIRCQVECVHILKEDAKAVGMRARVSVAKNKCAPPAEPVEFEMYFERGLCRATEALEMGLAAKVVERSGGGLLLDDTRLGQTPKEAVGFLKTHPEVLEMLVALVKGGA